MLVQVDDAQTSELLKKNNLKIVHRYRHFSWAICEGSPAAEAAAQSRGKAMAMRPAPEMPRMRLAAEPNDPNYANQLTFHPTAPDAEIYLPQAWDIRTTATEPVIAVIDSGADVTHPDLADNFWVNTAEAEGTPGVDDDGNGYVDDVHGWNFVEQNNDLSENGALHGSQVCGVIGAVGNNGIGITGVCWRARIMVLRCFGTNDTDTTIILEAIDYALSRPEVKIINASWGGDEPVPALRDAIEAAGRQGVVVVAAAGNGAPDGYDITSTKPFYPASYDLDNMITVMAIDLDGGRPNFSNYGDKVTVAAPGASVYTTYHDNGYVTTQGTSFATPVVSGAVALLLSERHWLSPAAIKRHVITTARHTESLAQVPLLSGLINVRDLLLTPNVSAARDWLLYEP